MYDGAGSDGHPLPDHAYRVIENQVYTPEHWPERLYADVYLPETGAGGLPAVLLVHGGGWEKGERADVARIARTLARYGFAVFNVSYRLAPAHRFPAPLEDLQVAMRWIHTRAAFFGVDRQRISAFGYSAGAHLVSLLGAVAGTGNALDRAYGGPLTRPVAVVAGGIPSDLRKFTGGRLVPQFLGGRIEEVPGRFAQASPAYHAHAGAPPHFLYHGTMDVLVPVDHATDYATALRSAGVPVELYLMRLRGHITAFLTDRHALRTAAGFLRRHTAGAASTADSSRAVSRGSRCPRGSAVRSAPDPAPPPTCGPVPPRG